LVEDSWSVNLFETGREGLILFVSISACRFSGEALSPAIL
jgi:hypothetical protein